jgi:hypothetical protein
MLDLIKIDPGRQRRVSLSLSDVLSDKAFVRSLSPRVREALNDAVSAGDSLGRVHSVAPFAVDGAADSAFSGFYAVIVGIETTITDALVQLSPALVAKRTAATTLRRRAFPNGTAFLTKAMPVQLEGMTQVMSALTHDANCVAAVNELGLGYLVAHLSAHMDPYRRSVSTSDQRDLEALSARFHEAVRTLCLRTLDDHARDDETRARLLSAYERELEAQRNEDRAARKRAKERTTSK